MSLGDVLQRFLLRERREVALVLSHEPGHFVKSTKKGIQVPGVHAMVERGPLDGRVLVTEVRGLYQLQFKKGAVDDLGVFGLGGGLPNLVTGVGIQP